MQCETTANRGLTCCTASSMIVTSHPKMPAHTGRSGGTMSKCFERSFALQVLALCVPAFTDVPVPAPAETADRLKVVDFVIYSSTSVCMFGLASNPKFASAKSVDDLNKPEITIAYYTGGGEEGWVKERFPKAQLRGVAGSGVAPVEEVMAKRADAVPINRVPWVAMGRKLKGLAVLPKESNCQDSMEKAQPVGLA